MWTREVRNVRRRNVILEGGTQRHGLVARARWQGHRGRCSRSLRRDGVAYIEVHKIDEVSAILSPVAASDAPGNRQHIIGAALRSHAEGQGPDFSSGTAPVRQQPPEQARHVRCGDERISRTGRTRVIAVKMDIVIQPTRAHERDEAQQAKLVIEGRKWLTLLDVLPADGRSTDLTLLSLQVLPAILYVDRTQLTSAHFPRLQCTGLAAIADARSHGVPSRR